MQDDKNSQGTELVALSFLAEQTQPVGSPRLVTEFRAEGIDVAEATVGRFLRVLDERGLTVRVGRQGRMITERGRQRLQHVQLKERLDTQSSELVRILGDSDSAELIDVLNLRRAVEGEAARLAAIRATSVECERLQSIASQHDHHVTTGEEGINDALTFHLEVAHAAHSPIVQTVIELLIEPVNDPYMKVLDIIALDAGAQFTFAHEHSAIADAISNRNPDDAERAMRRHIDDLIETVKSFLSLHPLRVP